jgi:hypothetical protein
VARINFDITWDDDARTVIRYRARELWTWKDYHAAVHVSLWSLQNSPHPIDCVIDVRGGTRHKLPAGLAGHARTFGKKISPTLTGRAVAVGFPREAWAVTGADADGRLMTPDGEVVFVDDDAQVAAVIARWRSSDQSPQKSP